MSRRSDARQHAAPNMAAGNKRPRTRSAAKRAAEPTYERPRTRSAAKRAAKPKCEQLERRNEGGATTTTEEVDQGRKWREFFLKSDIFREHIAPEIGDTCKAILIEACGTAVSYPVGDRRRRKKRKRLKMVMDHDGATGSIPLLQWCIARGYKMVAETMIAAAEGGHLDVVKYLHENGCPWESDSDYESCDEGNFNVWAAAASTGHLDVLKYVIDAGLPFIETKKESMYARTGAVNVSEIMEKAAYGGHLNVLKYAHEIGWHFNSFTCNDACRGGHLDVLKYIFKIGCKYPDGLEYNYEECFLCASDNGYEHIVKFLNEWPYRDDDSEDGESDDE